MNVDYELFLELKTQPRRWLVTGAAGFIGSNILELLLRTEQHVVGLDNFATGKKHNLTEVLRSVSEAQRSRFHFIEGDIRDPATCQAACKSVDYVLHQAALGSVPRSINDPLTSNETNVTGFLNMLVAARDQKVKRFVYASSSSVYGDDARLPKVETRVGHPLSPYAVTKAANELYANVFWRTYKLETIGLRYFNVFGPRQDPDGAYAAVIPRWIAAMLRNQPVFINGDGSTSRDFCFVANAVQANIRAALTESADAIGMNFNIALNRRASLLELFELIRCKLVPDCPHLVPYQPTFNDFRAGDIAHSQADTSMAENFLGYVPTHTLEQGLEETVEWFRKRMTIPDLQP